MTGLRIGVIAIAVVLCAATSPPRYRYPRSYPVWRVAGATQQVTGCGEVKAWISKSGKTGVGVTVRITPSGAADCDVRVAAAALEIGGRRIEAAALPAPSDHMYIPFAFDNEASWNRGERTGRLILQLDPGPEIAVAIEHHRGPPHHKVDNWGPRAQPQRPPPKRTQ